MAKVVQVGGGIVGLCTGMLLAKDGHDVTLLERDPSPLPSPDDAWEAWNRTGVNQFRLPHFLLPGFRAVMDAELPEVIVALLEAGANRFNGFGPFAEAMDPNGEHDIVTARRPIVEAAVAGVANATDGLTIRRVNVAPEEWPTASSLAVL